MNSSWKKNNQIHPDIIDSRSHDKVLSDARDWMIQFPCHLSAGHLDVLNDFAESMGMTFFKFLCLPWAQYGSKNNPRMSMYLSHRFLKLDKETETTYETWNCISFFLVKHLKLAGGLATIFHWDEAEYLFRIGGTYQDLFALSRRNIEMRVLDVLSKVVAYRSYYVTAEKYLWECKLDAALLCCDTRTPSPIKKPQKKFSMDMETDDKFDLGEYSSDNESDSESVAAPVATKNVAASLKTNSVADAPVVGKQVYAPSLEVFQSNSVDIEDKMVVEMAQMKMDISRINTLFGRANPPSPFDSGDEASKDDSIMEFDDSPRKQDAKPAAKGMLKQAPPCPSPAKPAAKGMMKQAPPSPSPAKTIFESPIPDSAPSTVFKTPTPTKPFSDGSSEKPIEFDDSPAVSPINKFKIIRQAASTEKMMAKSNEGELVDTPSTAATGSTTSSALKEDWQQERTRNLESLHNRSLHKSASKIAKRTLNIKSGSKAAKKSSSKKPIKAASIFFKQLSVTKPSANKDNN